MSERAGSFLAEKRPDRCCGGCLPVHESIKCLGIWSILQTILVFVQGSVMVYDEQWIGFYLIFFNVMYIMNSIAYYKWFNEDCYESRQCIRKTYKWILIQSMILYTALLIIVYHIPPEALPDKYEDSWGNEYDFPPDKKEDMKNFAMYFIIVFAIFTIWIQCYVYFIVKKWASKDKLIEHAKYLRITSARSTSRRPNTGRSTRSQR